MRDIDEILQALEDPSETFTSEEVRSLVDYEVTHAHRDLLVKTKIASIMQTQAQKIEDNRERLERLSKMAERTEPLVLIKEVHADNEQD